MVKRLILVVAGLLLLVAPSVSGTQAAMPASKGRPGVVVGGHHVIVVHHVVGASNVITGTLTSMTTATLTVNVNNTAYTVNILPKTKFVRLYNGRSDLDELSIGDQLAVSGSQTATNTVGATVVKDLSIQEAWTHMSGTITSVSGNTVVVTVLRDALNAPFSKNQSLTLAIGSATKVMVPSGTRFSVMAGTAAMPSLSAATGTTVTVLGVYNKAQSAFTTVYRLRIHHTRTGAGSVPTAAPNAATATPVPAATGTTAPTSAATSVPGAATPTAVATTVGSTTAGRSVTVAGNVVSDSGSTAPAVLTVQTARFGLITVNIASSPAVVFTRRLGGSSALDEVSSGDSVSVRGTFTDSTNKTLNATALQDFSIQDAATRAVLQITQVTATGFVGTVMADNVNVPHPFSVGQTVTVTVGSSTKIVVPATSPATGDVTGSQSNLAINQTITVLGVFNRNLNSYDSADLVRIHR